MLQDENQLFANFKSISNGRGNGRIQKENKVGKRIQIAKISRKNNLGEFWSHILEVKGVCKTLNILLKGLQRRLWRIPEGEGEAGNFPSARATLENVLET